MKENIDKFNTIDLMRTYNVQPSKNLGQNFLHDLNIVEKIVLSANIDKEDTVIEVGPGLGVMTVILAKYAKQVIAVEIDKKLIPVLNNLTKEYSNIKIINRDILKTDLKNDLFPDSDVSRVKVVANLPYYITTPIVMKFLEEDNEYIDSLTFLVQKEVAERICASPGGKEYGALTVAIEYFAESKILFNVPPQVFIPRPGVDSSVVRLTLRKNAPFELEDKAYFFKVVKAAFGQRRKTLANALVNSGYLNVTRDMVYEALDNMGKDRNIRGETLSGNEFATLSNLLFNLIF